MAGAVARSQPSEGMTGSGPGSGTPTPSPTSSRLSDAANVIVSTNVAVRRESVEQQQGQGHARPIDRSKGLPEASRSRAPTATSPSEPARIFITQVV